MSARPIKLLISPTVIVTANTVKEIDWWRKRYPKLRVLESVLKGVEPAKKEAATKA